MATGVNPTARYERAPSPPYIEVPIGSFVGAVDASVVMVPQFSDIDAGDLTEEDLKIITQGQAQSSNGCTNTWKYEDRREAQPITDFLYLGPSSAARDGDFLRTHGITMVLACKDSQFGAPMLGVQKVVGSMGIAFDSIDISPGNPDLVANFPIAVRKINDHLLSVYRRQALNPATQEQQQAMPAGQMAIDQSKFRRGKVLVCCETGNGRSAAIVAAYLMAVLGADAVKAMTFVLVQRFSALFDDESKNHLLSYEDILKATRDVVRQRREQNPQQQTMKQPSVQAGSKRRIDDVGEDDLMEDASNPVNRGMAPFTDTSEWEH